MNIKSTSCVSLILIFFVSSSYAAGDMTAQAEIPMTVTLGNVKNSLRFYPDKLEFETGKLYKLIITNPSRNKHYFSAEGLARSVFTRKVQILNNSNNIIAEVKGHINEIEVYPNGKTEWWFVPIKTLEKSLLRCSIKGHTEAGMRGQITIR